MIKELTKLANHLDSKGLRKEADYLDAVIRKVADEKTPMGMGTARRIEEFLECRVGGIKVLASPESPFATSVKVSVEPKEIGYDPGDSSSTFTTNISSIMDGAYWADYVVINSFILSALTCFVCSTLMHTFLPMNEDIGNKLLKADYFGISTMIIGSYTPFIYYSFYCHREIKLIYLGVFYFVGLIIIGLNCTKYFTNGENYRKRVVLYALYGMLSIIPIIHRLIANYKNEGNYALELEYTLLAGLLYCVAIFFYVSHAPERWYGNKFAIYFSSHQIFHCFILIASMVQYTGIILTYYSEEGTICPIPIQS